MCPYGAALEVRLSELPVPADASASWVLLLDKQSFWSETAKPKGSGSGLMDRLDQASLSHCTLKFTFKPLGRDQVQLAFERFFGMPTPASVAGRPDPREFRNCASQTHVPRQRRSIAPCRLACRRGRSEGHTGAADRLRHPRRLTATGRIRSNLAQSGFPNDNLADPSS